MDSPLVSVIIPAYNCEKYIELAVRSIMTQTYKNLEILVTDDCSTDNTLEILSRLANEDARIRVAHNEQNKRIVKTLNSLVSRANGKYIVRMDADDISLPGRIERQVRFMEANPNIGICGTNAWHIDEKNKLIGCSRLPLKNDEVSKFLVYKCPLYHPTVCIRRELIEANRYSERFLNSEDYELWLRLSKITEIANLKDRLLYYRIHSSQISKTFSSEQKILGKELIKCYKLVPENLLDIFCKVFYENTKLTNGDLKDFRQFSKKLITGNASPDLVLFIQLIRTHNYLTFFLWNIKEFLFLIVHMFQTKLWIRLWKVKK